MLIPVMEQFDACLLKLPPLLNRLENHAATNFSLEALQWLHEVCQLSEQNHLLVAADLAIVRTDLLLFSPRTMTEQGNPGSKRQQTDRFAVECLTRAHDLLVSCFAPLRQTYQECEPLCRQALAVAAAKGKLSAKDPVEKAISCLRTDTDLLPVWTQIVGKLGAANAQVLLDRTILQIE